MERRNRQLGRVVTALLALVVVVGLLDEGPTLPIRLVAFRACSGAKTIDVIQGKNGEPGQLDALNADVDIVTISIGGNDAEFEPFVKACFITGCSMDSDAYLRANEPLLDGSLRNSLIGEEGVYTRIASQASRANVYVVGYPQIVPATTGVDLPPYCMYLGDREKIAARTLVGNLNRVIQLAAAEMGPRFHYVDATAPDSPFVGHELCNIGTYFVAPTLPKAYTMHPNEKGQSAYTQLVRKVLDS